MSNLSYKINFEAFSNNFALPKEIVDDNFENLDSIYLKVILIIYRNSDKNYSTNLLSNLLGVNENKISEAIEFWIEKNMLIFLPEETIVPAAVVLKKQTVVATAISNAGISKELSYLLECMENILARPITSAEHKTVVHIMEFLRLPADVILMAIDYCVSIDKVNARYIEKVCTTWTDNGIVTHEIAEQYLSLLKQSKSNEAKIQKIFGIEGRSLIDSEREFINRWVNEYKFDLSMIKLAYEKTIQAINKVAFAYINKILLSWHEKGYKTVSDVQENPSGSKGANSKPQTTSYDLEMLDKFWDNVPKLD